MKKILLFFIALAVISCTEIDSPNKYSALLFDGMYYLSSYSDGAQILFAQDPVASDELIYFNNIMESMISFENPPIAYDASYNLYNESYPIETIAPHIDTTRHDEGILSINYDGVIRTYTRFSESYVIPDNWLNDGRGSQTEMIKALPRTFFNSDGGRTHRVDTEYIAIQGKDEYFVKFKVLDTSSAYLTLYDPTGDTVVSFEVGFGKETSVTKTFIAPKNGIYKLELTLLPTEVIGYEYAIKINNPPIVQHN